MRVSVIIPTLNEAESIVQLLEQVQQAGSCELIVVDGGSKDGTLERAHLWADLVLSAPRGRASQMNAGARVAKGEVLLFLHGDTIPPPEFPLLLDHGLADPMVVGGRFDVRLDAIGWPYRMIECLMNFRSRLTRISTGDQGIFVRREVFHTLGGYPEVPLMEDLQFSRALKRAGKIACLHAQVLTSARRWQQNGIAKTIVLMWALRLCHFLGISPKLLKRFYVDTR